LQNDFNQRNQEKLVDVQVKYGKQYQDWATKQPKGASIRLESFLMDQITSNTDVGKALATDAATSEIVADLSRLNDLKKSHAEFESILINQYDSNSKTLKEGGALTIDAAAQALQGRMSNAVSQFSASAEARKKIHDEQYKQLRVEKVEVEIENQKNKAVEEQRRLEYRAAERELTAIQRQLSDLTVKMAESGGRTSDNIKAAEVLERQLRAANDKLDGIINRNIQYPTSSSELPSSPTGTTPEAPQQGSWDD
jgi:hypothetical protein